MDYHNELVSLRQSEADAVELGHASADLDEQDAHFAKAAECVLKIRAIEQQIRGRRDVK
jgi:hypothetical protein